jgi:nitrate reductase cytochrome c-type subunit
MALSVAVGCASRPEPIDATGQLPSAERPMTIPDSEIGLAHGTAFEQPRQEPIRFNSVDPGDSATRPRPNSKFPPVVPHSVEDLGPITKTDNPCLDCHDPEAAAYGDAPAVPPSHLIDLRRSPDVSGDEVVGARYLCVSCHVAQTETRPLVGNSSGR